MTISVLFATCARGWLARASASTGATKLVLVALCDPADQGDDTATASIACLGQFAGLSVAEVRESLAELVGLGELTIHNMSDDRVCYTVTVGAWPPCVCRSRASKRRRRPPP